MSKNNKIIYRSYKQSDESNPNSRNVETFVYDGNFRLVECGYAKIDNRWKNIVAYFPYYRIYLITEGSAQLQLKNSTLELKEGHLYYVPSFQIVSSNCSDSLEHYYLHFSPKREIPNVLEFFKPVQSVVATPNDVELFKELLSAFPKSDIANTIRKTGIFQYLLAKFYDGVEDSNNDILRFKEVLMYIDEHLDSPITTKKLASIANLSEVYFSNLFTKTFGVSPIKYINHKKMTATAAMLAENILSIKEIAFSLGFNNTTYFFKLFKKTFGITPGQYKAKCNSVLTSSKNE